MKIHFTSRIIIFFSTIFLCVAILSIISYKNGKTFHETSKAVEHTNKVLREAELTLSLAKDLNGGGRGYVATGDSAYLEYFTVARKTIFSHTDKLKLLADDGAEQLAKIDSLTALIHERLNLSSVIIKLKNEGHIKEANVLIEAQLNRLYMNKIRAIINEIEQDESNLLDERKAAYSNSIAVASSLFFILCFTLVMLLLVSFSVIRYNFNKREKAEVKIKESQHMFSSLFYKSPVMKAIAEAPTGKYIQVNDAFAAFWDSTEEKMMGKTSLELSLIAHADERIHILKQILEDGFVRDVETKIISKDGKVRWLSANIDSINLNGKDCYLVAAVDITKRKEAEESLANLNNELEQRVKERSQQVFESEKKYRHLFENNPMPMWIIDLFTFRFLDVNEAALVHYGYCREEFLAMSALDIRPDEEKNRFKELNRPSNFEEANYNRGIWTHLKKNGTAIQAEVLAHEISFEGLEARLILSNDVTEKIKAEEELKNIFERITDAFIALNKNWNYTYLNKKAATMHGRTPAELIGKNIWKKFPEVVDEPFYVALHEAMEKQEPQHLELYYSKTNSWYEDFIYPSPDGISVYYRDITEKKNAEEELLKSEFRYRSLIEQASDGIFISDKNGKYLAVNSSACKMLGYSYGEMLTLSIGDLISKKDQKEKPIQYEALREGKSVISERRMIRKDGSFVTVEISSKMLPNGDFQGIARDVTERKKAEEKLNLSHQQMRNLAAHLQSVREEERVRIAREIHDELGQQLTGLKMDVSWLDKKLPQVNPGIREKVSEMLLLLDETVKTVRRISTELRPGILDDLGLMAALEWQSSEFEKRSNIRCKFVSGFSEERFDKAIATSIFRIFQEALTNIARHSGATEVNAELKAEADHILLLISDNGKGFNVDETKSKMTLGILGMEERALVMHGELTIHSEPGKGTSIRVEVPIPLLKTIES